MYDSGDILVEGNEYHLVYYTDARVIKTVGLTTGTVSIRHRVWLSGLPIKWGKLVTGWRLLYLSIRYDTLNIELKQEIK